MSDVGLDYLTLGQPLNTLSGGECQRIKLASELHKEGSIYVMDEPTTGLHKSDTAHLLEIMNKLVDGGNTVIVIEHNMDVVRNADWVIDLGPEGGSKGRAGDLRRHAGGLEEGQAVDHEPRYILATIWTNPPLAVSRTRIGDGTIARPRPAGLSEGGREASGQHSGRAEKTNPNHNNKR
jgi:energy-coupling factor transporter ATP-binding protein EcfA2